MSPSRLAPPMLAACTARLANVRRQLAEQRLDALLVQCEKDIQYLTGFVGHDSLLVVIADHDDPGAVIISDSRYDEFLDPWRQAGIADVVMGVRHRLAQAVGDFCVRRKVKRLGIQAEHVTIAGRSTLQAELSRQELAEATGVIARLRMRKDDLEVASIVRAIGIQQQAIAAALDHLAVGMSELEFSARLEFEMKSRGSLAPSFVPIIGAGANSSIIHHQTSSARIRTGVLLVDWGATVDGYCSDMTRTFAVGRMPAKVREVYSVVLEAQRSAIAAIAPGRICADIDAVARDVIRRAGYGDHFAHGLGHGLGLDIHEAPFFDDLQTDVSLEPGMVMTVEPGIYLPGVGGVRIEDDVLVTPMGARVLSDWPSDLDAALVEPGLGAAALGNTND